MCGADAMALEPYLCFLATNPIPDSNYYSLKMARTYTHILIDFFKIRKMLIELKILASTFYFLWFSHMPKMTTELLVVTTDTEYWHAGCYVEEMYAKSQFLNFIFECGALFTSTVAKPVNSREKTLCHCPKEYGQKGK